MNHPDTFTECLWKAVDTIYQDIVTHPFNVELAAGTLDAQRFGFYVQQDSLYLRDYARALALLAAKAPDAATANALLGYAQGGIAVEQALHGTFFKQFNLVHAEEREPACFAYTQFLLNSVALDSYEVGLAAVLPCFWVYREVGLRIKNHAVPSNPYAAWIDTYSDEAFGAAVGHMMVLTESAAASASTTVRASMLKAFVYSTRCEWWFWDAAYRNMRWPTHE